MFNEAEKAAILALKISKFYLSTTDDFYYAVLGNLGLFYQDSMLPDKTIALLKPTIKEIIKIYGSSFFGLSQIYNNLGSAYNDIENHQEALKYYKLALVIDENVHGLFSKKTTAARNNVAHIQSFNGYYDLALQSYKLNLDIYEKNNLIPNSLVYNNLALAYTDVNDFDNAHKMHIKAYETANNFTLSGHSDKTTVINNLITFYLQNDGYDNNLISSKKLSDELIQNLYASLKDLKIGKSLTVLNFFSGHYKAALTPFIVYSRMYFQKLITLKQFQQTFWLDSLQFDNFSTLDLSLQSVQLRESFKKLNIREFQDYSLDLDKLNKEYRRLTFLNNNDNLDHNKKIILLKNKIDKFMSINSIPKGLKPLKQSLLQSQINDNKLIIKFISDDFYMYAILISNDEVIPIKFSKDIQFYKNLFKDINLKNANFDFNIFKNNSHKVYKEIFLPIKSFTKNKKEFSFILEDFMFNLPPQAWIVKKSKSLFNRTPLYLIEKNFITLTPSLSSIKKDNKTAKNFNYKFVGIGFPSQLNGNAKIIEKVQISLNNRGVVVDEDEIMSTFAPLPNTKIELEYFNKTLSSLGKTKLLIADDATEFNIKKNDALSEAEIISFSTHALINNELNNDNEPSLIMTADNENDGFLTSSEIMYLKMKAKLVILSACNTASGFDNSSLGLTGLVNSFFYGGAEKVLATSWKINDKSTMKFNKYLADNIIKGSDIKKSVNKYIIEMINDPSYSNPHFWAAFSLISK